MNRNVLRLVLTCDFEYPYGSDHFVDIPCVFKNFDADPYDPDSYDFAMTDMYIQAICDCGTKTFYRLGVSIEHAPVKRNIYAPKDPQKWAVICEHIVLHYNEGWANGFHHNIEYWEIWNEPETVGGARKEMWIGMDEEYFVLYSITANHLKRKFPSIKVGGYASCGFLGAFDKNLPAEYQSFVEYADRFFNYINDLETKAPIDFFSWHIYTGDLHMLEKCAKYARELMARYGHADAESILDEWNYAGQDQKCAVLGAGMDEHTAIVSLGTGCCISARCARPIYDERRRIPCFSYLQPNSWVMEGVMSTGAACYQWFRDNFASGSSFDELNDLAAAAVPGREFFYPYLSGSASPHWSSASGGFTRLSLDSSVGSLARAVLEGVAYGIRENLEVMRQLGAQPSKLAVYGGGANSPLWMQIIADVTALPVEGLYSAQTALAGCAMLALSACGEKDVRPLPGDVSYLPDTARGDVYDKSYTQYLRARRGLETERAF